MIFYIVVGLIFATIGITLLNCICDILSGITELIKSKINLKIVKNNNVINQINNGNEPQRRAIGFATTDEEEDAYE